MRTKIYTQPIREGLWGSWMKRDKPDEECHAILMRSIKRRFKDVSIEKTVVKDKHEIGGALELFGTYTIRFFGIPRGDL